MNEFSELPADVIKHGGEKKKENPLGVTLNRVQKDIILKIAQEGLKSSASLERSHQDSSRSIDSRPSEYVYGRGFKPEDKLRNQIVFTNSIQQALYMTDNSILPVVAERQGESSGDNFMYQANKTQKQIVEARLAASMLVVFEGSDEDSHLTRKDEDLSADKIMCILLPKKMVISTKRNQNTVA
jgi:hypothetical protein